MAIINNHCEKRRPLLPPLPPSPTTPLSEGTDDDDEAMAVSFRN